MIDYQIFVKSVDQKKTKKLNLKVSPQFEYDTISSTEESSDDSREEL